MRRAGARRSTRPGWNTRRRARRAPAGSARPSTRRSGRRGRCWTAQAANRSHLLDSRQPSPAEVTMRRIGVAVVIALNLLLAPLAVEAQQPAEKVYRVGWIGASPTA